jgi:hypothetical protein
MAITVEHGGQHQATPDQLEEAGVDLEQVTGYRNESGVATTYVFEGEDIETVLREGEGEVQVVEEPSDPQPAPSRRSRAGANVQVPVDDSGQAQPS